MCVMVILLYYVGLIFMQNMGRVGKLEPYSSVCIPNIIMLMITIYTSYKMQKDLPFRLTEWVADRTIIIYKFSRNTVSKLVPQSPRQNIKPLKYERNREVLDETTKKIMREKMQNLK